MNKKYHPSETGNEVVRKEKTSRVEDTSQNFRINHLTESKEPIPVHPRLLQRYSFDDNGGGYKGL